MRLKKHFEKNRVTLDIIWKDMGDRFRTMPILDIVEKKEDTYDRKDLKKTKNFIEKQVDKVNMFKDRIDKMY